MSSPGRRLIVCLAAVVALAGPACSGQDEGSSQGASTTAGTGGPTSSTTSTISDAVVDDIKIEDCPPGTDGAGVTPATSSSPGVVRLMTSHPTAGASAASAQISYGAQARFALENDDGGVEVAGERYLVEVDARNDAGDPVATEATITAGFDPAGSPAFAAFGLVGTDNIALVRDQLTRWCVPDVFPVSASADVSVLGGWSVGAPVVLETTEAAALVRHLTEVRPAARLALLVPEGDRGKRIEAAFVRAVEGTALTVAAVDRLPVGVDTDVRAQVAALAESGADVFVDAAELLSCPAAIRVADELAWPSLVLAAGGCAEGPFLAQAGDAADGVLSATNLMDPSAPRWESHARVVSFRRAVASWMKDNPDVLVGPDRRMMALGWTMGDLFLRALSASSGVTRSELMESLTSLEASEPGLILDGITLVTGPADRWLGESARVVRFDATELASAPVGAVANFEGGLMVPPEQRPDS